MGLKLFIHYQSLLLHLLYSIIYLEIRGNFKGLKLFSKFFTLSCIIIMAIFLALNINSAIAEENNDVIKILKDFKTNRTNAPIRMTSNKNKIIKLEKDAASVIVNNPNHASVMLDNPRLLIVVPHQSGATSFTVLDKDGQTIMERDVIISNTQAKHVRIRRMCGDDTNCQPSSYFYCPDGCYEVTSVPNENTNNSDSSLRPSNYGNNNTPINMQMNMGE